MSGVDSPADRYAKLLSSGELVADDGQALAVAALDDLYQRFMTQAAESGGALGSAKKNGLFARLLNRFSDCLLYTSPSPRDATLSRMPSSA